MNIQLYAQKNLAVAGSMGSIKAVNVNNQLQRCMHGKNMFIAS